MKTLRLVIVGIAAVAFRAAPGAPAEDPWADEVLDYSPGPGALLTNPGLTVGTPVGGGPSRPDNSSVVSLGGQGGSITLKFSTPVTDDPGNAFGLDCIVYSNAFWTAGNPQVTFQEPAIIEISEDVNGNGAPDDPWYLIPGCRDYPYAPFPQVDEPAGQSNSPEEPDLLAGNIRNPNTYDADPANDQEEYNWGYAEMTPTMKPYLDNYVRPDDPLPVGLTPRSGGGDAFDIAWAVDEAGDPAPITQFHFIRITAFIDRVFGALGAASPEIDAVADVALDADADGDDVLDEYETRVAGTDPARRESTVLPLEIPAIEGGSPPGTLLGTAQDDRGVKLRLYADQQRTAPDRDYNINVDILAPAGPGSPLPDPGLLKSGTVCEIVSAQSDFVAAGIQPAQVTMPYTSAEIAGLDEPGLEPYLHAGQAYTQAGITDVEVNEAANRVTFHTQYAGLFLLASMPGAGDTGSQEGPQGDIALVAAPAGEIVADPANAVTVTSGVIRDHEDAVVEDGTLITVAASRGDVATPDAGPQPGVQVTTVAGTIAFDVQASSEAGSLFITATSVEGGAYGEAPYAFIAGNPVPSVSWTLGEPEHAGSVTVPMTSSVVRDQFGNVVADGTLLTVEVVDGAVASGDADLALPGYQVMLDNGRATLTIEVPTDESVFTLRTYADPGQTALLGEGAYSPADYVPMPLRGVAIMFALMLLALARGVGKARVDG